jgi:Mg-chelatase subunit ChlD
VEDRIRKWRLILGKTNEEGNIDELDSEDQEIDKAVGALYQPDLYGDLQGKSPKVQKWLADIKNHFPSDQVTIMQKDALEKLDLIQLLQERELIDNLIPDINLASNILSMKHLIPDDVKSAARTIIEKIASKFSKEIGFSLVEKTRGALNYSIRTRKPKFKEINWTQTIKSNLKNYEQSVDAIILKQLLGNKPKGKSFDRIYLLVDQSYSMTGSLIYAGLTAGILSRLPALNVHLILFSNEVVDVTEQLSDPVELLFGLQLGGGTDIHKACAYTNKQLDQPTKSVLILISDLFEGGSEEGALAELLDMQKKGAKVVCIPSLSDESKPSFDKNFAQRIRNIDIPVFNCSPSRIPDLFNTLLKNGDLKSFNSK